MSGAILASSVSVRTLSDGTLRLSVDIEPADAQAAFALFGKPGSPIGLARITNAAATAHDRARTTETPSGTSAGHEDKPAPAASAASPSAADRKPLSIASRVALTCRDPEFHEFLRTAPSGFAMEWTRPHNYGGDPAEIAERLVKGWCTASRKRDIETSPKALARWRDLNGEFQQWMGSRELARRTGRAA